MAVRGWAAALVLAAMSLAACSAAGDPSGGPAATTPSPAAAGPIGPLTFGVDQARAAQTTATLVTGGSVTATGSDGTTYALVVPPGAVPADTVVRVVPLTDVKGIPTTTPVLAVRLEPDGLEFVTPAHLTITPATSTPLREQFLFEASQDGTGIAAAEVDPRSQAMVMAVPHFSIAGEAGVNDSTIDQIMGVELGDKIGELQRREQNAFTLARRERLLGDPGANNEALPAIIAAARKETDDAIDLAVKNFPTRCSTAQDLVAFMTGVERQGQLLNVPGARTAWWQAAETAYPICEKEAIRACKAARKPPVLIRFWLGWSRQQGLVGAGGGLDLNALTEKADKICRPQRYLASGGGALIAVSGRIKDLSRPFTLTGKGAGFAVNFLYLPKDDTGGSGTLTYEGSGGGAMLSGSGTYTIAGDPASDGPLTMTVTTNGCADVGGCKDNVETVTLTPTRVAF